MESTIGMLKSRKHELKEDNTRLRHELMDKEKSLNNMRTVCPPAHLAKRETNARLIVRLQLDMVNVCKHKFYKIGGKIRTVRHIALRGQRIKWNQNPYLSHPATWVKSQNDSVRDFYCQQPKK